MKIAVGVDSDNDQTKLSIDLLAKLKFPKAQLDLLYVIESMSSPDSLLAMQNLTDDANCARYLDYRKNIGASALSLAQEMANGAGMAAETRLLSGSVANRLISYTKESGAELLALSSSGKGSWEGILIGSVSRKAVINSQASVLLAKASISRERGLKVVFATDHSDYCNRCVKLLADLAPQGIQEIVVTSIYPSLLIQSMRASSIHFKTRPEDIIRKELAAANESYRTLLAPLNCTISSRIEEGFVNETIARVMEEEGADLLILGAQGHGFSDRMAMGSVSLKQAITQKKSVLILRLDDEMG